jgi:hypothetical protein
VACVAVAGQLYIYLLSEMHELVYNGGIFTESRDSLFSAADGSVFVLQEDGNSQVTHRLAKTM